MTITREQLEKAAKAAGIKCIEYTNDYDGCYGLMMCDYIGRHTETWDPMHNRGQLLDLAMACKIAIEPRANSIIYDVGSKSRIIDVNCQDFPALAEAVILAACEQLDAKPKLAPDTAKQLLESIEYERLGGDD